MEHKDRHLRIVLRGPQRADEPVDLPGLEVGADLVGQRLDALRRQHVLNGDLPFGALGEPLGHLGSRVTVQLGQRVENAARGLAGDDRPGGERHPLRRIARRHIGIERLGDRFLVERLCRPGQIGLGAIGRRTGRVGWRRRNWQVPGRRGRRRGRLIGFGAAVQQLGLRPGDLVGRLSLLVLVQLLDLVAVLDRVLDQLLDGVEVGVAHGRQLDGRQVEVVFDAVLDPHRHQRVQTQLDQRHLPRQVLGLVTHRRTHDRAQPLGDGLAGIR